MEKLTLAQRASLGANLTPFGVGVVDPGPVPARPVTAGLRHLRLADGSLAWPAAQAAGICEAAFLSRLFSMSADDAISAGSAGDLSDA